MLGAGFYDLVSDIRMSHLVHANGLPFELDYSGFKNTLAGSVVITIPHP
jgi:hypothetical protein